MNFFISSEITLGVKILEIIFIIMGGTLIYTGIKNLKDKENISPVGTAVFWCVFGVILAFGRWMPVHITGALVIIMTIPGILKKVKVGKNDFPTSEYTSKMANKIGMKLFIPALTIGGSALYFVLFTKLGALVGVGIGVIISMVMLMLFSKENKPTTFLNDGKRLLDSVGPLSVLPMLLASLGAVYTKAGVGDTIAAIVGKIIPEGNVNVGIIVFALGMAIFTMIMGNAFAAITVITVGIGGPFVLAHGADPKLIGMLALTCGYCGTLLTPMAANFNIVPVAMLEMKDKYGVIKNQCIIAILMLVFQIVYMIIFK
ncbi:MAG: DUF979 domain-containing protein [Fusobacteriaceae bacterium]